MATPQHNTLTSATVAGTAVLPSAEPLRFLTQVLELAVRSRASDIHLRVRRPPMIRVDGVLHPLPDFPVLSVTDTEAIAQKIMSARHWESFQRDLQADLSAGIKGVGRMRVNAFFQRGTIALSLRVINTRIPTPQELKLPPVVGAFTGLERGLVILTGATGSGKSTTIASLINEINFHQARHIITIEDPIEYLFQDQRAMISQREIGIDAPNFAMAMRAALREDPDVILLGEMRDPESIDIALTAAETGHLVFSTLHAPATAETVTRMISSFLPEAQPTIRAKLAANLVAVVAQRLLPHASGKGRTVACEVLTVSQRVRELILDPLRVKDIADLVRKSSVVEGMLHFDQHLLDLYKRGEITDETALQHATSATDLRLKLEGFK